MSIAISIITGLIALSFYTKTKDEKCKYIIKKIDEEIGVEYFSNYLQKEIEIKKAINDILK